MELKIGYTLKNLLESKRLSIRELAKRTGVPASTLSEWHSNRQPRNLKQIQHVASFLGVSMHYLIFGVDDPEEPIQKILKEDVFSGTYEITIKRVKIQK